MREAFEKWYVNRYPQSYMQRNPGEDGSYKVSIIQYAWAVWQGACATKEEIK